MNAVISAELWKFEFIWWDLGKMFVFGREISGILLIFAHVETSWHTMKSAAIIFETYPVHTEYCRALLTGGSCARKFGTAQ